MGKIFPIGLVEEPEIALCPVTEGFVEIRGELFFKFRMVLHDRDLELVIIGHQNAEVATSAVRIQLDQIIVVKNPLGGALGKLINVFQSDNLVAFMWKTLDFAIRDLPTGDFGRDFHFISPLIL